MDYKKELSKFINSQYLHSGARITAGVLIPAFILYHFNILAVYTALPLGALCVSLTDSPGPAHHRRNSLIASIIINCIIVFITGYVRVSPWLIMAAIILFGMFFSLIGVYGSRISSIGLIALLVFIFNIDSHIGKHPTWYTAALFTAGGLWYAFMSLVLYTIRPYKLIQQLLGECLFETGNYLQTKAGFYEKDGNYDVLYSQLIHYQVIIRQHQDDLREMLFKTRRIVSESTTKGRILMLIFLDSIDLFERIMTSQQDYAKLHAAFEDSGMLKKLENYLSILAQQLQDIGLAVQSGFPSHRNENLDALMQGIMDDFASLRKEKLTPDTIEDFIMLRQILYSLQDLTDRINRLHHSTTYDKHLSKTYKQEVALDAFVTHQELDPKLLLENLTFKSSHFRHAARVTIALLLGYVISLLYPVGHSYWILLTIATIIKPAYSITRQRNIRRVLGTLAGAALGFLILYLIHDNTVLFLIMVVSMILSYSFIKLNYFIGTLGITVYVVISFNFLSANHFTQVLADRILDTVIGSVIAAVIAAFVLPVWEHEQIKSYITAALEGNRNYFKAVAQNFTGSAADVTAFKLSRKNAFVALANLSDNFQRMLSEPKNKQRNMELYHQFVSSSHMLTSYIASLSYYAQKNGNSYASEEFIPLVQHISQQFDIAIELSQHATEVPVYNDNSALPISKKVQELMELRRKEVTDGNFDQVTQVRKNLSDLKTIANQFSLISNITINEIRVLEKLQTGTT